ncbi:hemerythrin superfamily protein [Spinactinospora alkalitolerans]|uniref:Hemerythrin superfamily protein n=1 Tax=Spinactinospora alkalitolerans TaxID=687207 RepID=A0A852U2W4_9ACTN|nr:hemerythrin domain-containing protein [Spinactinospora alkalitolerans]NYE49273.1 hemerythrin superfamily protein [Spinactinospora alkalitolerans]
MARDAITLIKQDHRDMEEMFDRLSRNRDERSRLLPEMAARFLAHSRAEEQQVYPVVAREAGERKEVHHGAEEHHEAEAMLRRLQETDPGSAQFDDRLKEFVDAVKHHIEEEESEVLPGLADAVGKDRLKELGDAFDRMRQEEVRRLMAGSAEERSKMVKEQLAEEVDRARRASH